MRTEENKRKSAEEEGYMVKKTVKYTKTLQKAEAKREAEGVQKIVEVAEVVVNEEESEWRAKEEPQVEGGRRLGSGTSAERLGGGDE